MLGICVPVDCANHEDVQVLIEQVLNRVKKLRPGTKSVQGEYVEMASSMYDSQLEMLTLARNTTSSVSAKYKVDSVHPFKRQAVDASVIAMIVVWLVLFAMVVLSTGSDYLQLACTYKRAYLKAKQDYECSKFEYLEEDAGVMIADENDTLLSGDSKKRVAK